MVDKPDIERFVSVGVVSEILDCTTTYVYNLISMGKLKSIKIGARAIRVSVTSLNVFIEEGWIDPEACLADKEDDEKPTAKYPKQTSQKIARSNWMTTK